MRDQTILRSGGWDAEDEMIEQATLEFGSVKATLKQAKIYRQHRKIERPSGHARKVKNAQGTRCKGCDVDHSDKYGPIAHELVDAHHLTPIASLVDGEVMSLDFYTDFAVLCPNCHRVIHRMDDPSDIEALRLLLNRSRST